MQRTRLLRPDQLTREHIAAWSEIQQRDPSWDSPYFRPEFTQAVASVRDDVQVAVVEENGAPSAFFPFQRGLLNAGKPVGGVMSDFHGVIARKDAQVRPATLVRDCRLASWNFSHLVAPRQEFEGSVWKVEESPYIDLAGGFEHYVAQRRKVGSQLLGQALKKAAKIEKTLGPLRLDIHTSDAEVFRTLLEWKSAQYRYSGAPNVFAANWTVNLLRKILERQDKAFGGILSSLYIGDRLAAIHLGMRSHGVLHAWFPAFDVELAKHSVGLILFVELAKACESLGITRIDLGKGPESFKRELMSGAKMVAEGFVARHRFSNGLRRAWRGTREYVKASPFAGAAKSIRGWFGPVREWMVLR